MSDLEKKTIIVTGGTRGIGFAIARVLLEKGSDVVLTGRTTTSVDEALAKFAALGLPKPRGYLLELSDRTSTSRFAAEIAECYALVNCAGTNERSRLGEENWDRAWDAVMRVNLDGPSCLTNLLAVKLSKPGRIVNIASQLGIVGRAGYSAYCASKFGLIGLTQTWSRELAPRGVTVNAVCPGWIETEMIADEFKEIASIAGTTPEQARADIENRLDQRRFNTPEEVANIVAFLLSPEASGITGRCIEMAGPSA